MILLHGKENKEMNGKNILLDSNLIIYLAKGLVDSEVVIAEEYEYYISVITYMEILGYSFKSDDEENSIVELIKQFSVLYLDQNIAQKVIMLRKKHRIKLPDAICQCSEC
jgi:predicted nucleic acid-binding protein